MPTEVRLAILGLGRAGGSLALSLAGRDELRVAGFDREPEVAALAKGRGLRHAHWNLLHAVAGADLVLLAEPFAQQRETLGLIASELRAGAVIALIGPLLAPPLAWAAELVAAAPGRHLVACHPVLNPARLHDGATGPAAADAGLFAGGLWALAPAHGCAPEALRLVAELVRLLEATPYFVDPAEHDGLAAATEALPALLAVALFQAAAASPGWPEARKLAERSFATATLALAEAEPAAWSANRAGVLHYLDAALAELARLRQYLAAGEPAALDQALADAAERRAAWLAERARGEWEAPGQPAADLPSAGGLLGRALLGGLLPQRKPKRGGE